jgi:hypothetical protein
MGAERDYEALVRSPLVKRFLAWEQISEFKNDCANLQCYEPHFIG